MLFGKLPTQGDFVRSHLQTAQGVAFEAWLSGAVEQARGRLPDAPVRFLLSLGEPQRRVVGVWVASRDRVGREFPLAALHLVTLDSAGAPWSLLPAFYASLLDDLQACLIEHARSEAKQLIAAVDALHVPHESLIPAAYHEGQGALSDESLRTFLERNLAGAEPASRLAYALHTVHAARKQNGAPLTLDLPFVNEVDLFGWLEVLRACAVEPPPHVVWCESKARALATLGSPALATLAFLIDPAHPSQRLWPLRTEQPAAMREAMTRWGSRIERWLSDDLSVLQAIESMGQMGAS